MRKWNEEGKNKSSPPASYLSIPSMNHSKYEGLSRYFDILPEHSTFDVNTLIISFQPILFDLGTFQEV